MKTIDSECQLSVFDVHSLFPNEYSPVPGANHPPCAKFSQGFGAGVIIIRAIASITYV
jgi:hypothetical protein